jgi:ribosomal protein S18 acetylase RimI-like enzyme
MRQSSDPERRSSATETWLFEEVVPPCSPLLLQETRCLFIEYAESLSLDLEFQDFAQELDELPGKYAPPRGCLILARPGNQGSPAAGCIALRPLEREICELKRLYVRPAHRNLGLGRSLSVRMIEKAVQLGYRRMRLDTLASMEEATRLYRSLGFKEIAPYYHNPLPQPLFFEMVLS